MAFLQLNLLPLAATCFGNRCRAYPFKTLHLFALYFKPCRAPLETRAKCARFRRDRFSAHDHGLKFLSRRRADLFDQGVNERVRGDFLSTTPPLEEGQDHIIQFATPARRRANLRVNVSKIQTASRVWNILSAPSANALAKSETREFIRRCIAVRIGIVGARGLVDVALIVQRRSKSRPQEQEARVIHIQPFVEPGRSSHSSAAQAPNPHMSHLVREGSSRPRLCLISRAGSGSEHEGILERGPAACSG